MTDPTATDRVTAIYDAIDAFQRTHRLPGLQHAQLRGLLAEHLARALPAAPVPPVPADGQRRALRDRIAEALYERERSPRDPAWADAFAMDRETFEPMADAVMAVADAEQAATRGGARRAAKAEALLLRFTAEAHRRKWSYDRGLDDDGVPLKSEAFDALHRLGEEMRIELDRLRRMAGEEQPACIHPEGYDRECPCPPSCACCRVTAADEEQPASTAPLAAGMPLVKGRCPACRHASLFLGTGGYPTCSNADCTEPDAATTVLEQYANEAQPPYHRWYVEQLDPVADQWAPGTRFTDRAEAVERYRLLNEHGTPADRRFVRETTTYTVEQPAAVARQDGEG
ncbi:hypothetical protein ACWCQN_13135 [Streptomyces sp. NPDC001984]